MKGRTLSWVVVLGMVVSPVAQAVEASELCAPLRAFVTSVGSGETHQIDFHAIWGSNFKGRAQDSLAAKECDHGGYTPAQAVCLYLVKHGLSEFAEINVINTVACLSKKTRFGDDARLDRLDTTLAYKTRGRRFDVTIRYGQDEAMGGTVMTVIVVAD